MTLLLAMVNEKHAVLVADRRVTSDGRLVDDEQNKLCILFCDDAKLAIAFTGLATYQTFDTSEWIATTLSEIGAATGDIASILVEFTHRAEAAFATLAWLAPQVTILFCGFVYTGGTIESRLYVLSNAEHPAGNTQGFSLYTYADTAPKVLAAGVSTALSNATHGGLLALLQNPTLSPQSLLHYAVKRLRTAAADGRSGGLVGEQFNAAVLLSPPDTIVTSTYHSARGSYSAYGANVVVTQGMITLGTEIHAPTLLSGPEIRKQDPCWCGSGELFKHCHLKKYGAVYVRLPTFSRPMSWLSRLEVQAPRPSGRVFAVASSFA
jgi:SEC-C motif